MTADFTARITEILTEHDQISDPAVVAVRSAAAANGDWPWDSTSGAMLEAAREALKPIRELVKTWERLVNPWDTDLADLLEDLKPLVYTSEELER